MSQPLKLFGRYFSVLVASGWPGLSLPYRGLTAINHLSKSGLV